MTAGQRFFKWALSKIGTDDLQYPFIYRYIRGFMAKGLDLNVALDLSTREKRDAHEAALRERYENALKETSATGGT